MEGVKRNKKQKQWFKHNSLPCTNPLCPSLQDWTSNPVTQSCGKLHSVPFEPQEVPSTLCELLSPFILPAPVQPALCSFSTLFCMSYQDCCSWACHTMHLLKLPLSRLSSFPREGGVFLSLRGPTSLKSLKGKQLNSEQIRKPNTEQQARNGLWLVPSHWTLILKLKEFRTRKCSPQYKLLRFCRENKTEKLDGVSQRKLKE